MLAPVFMRSPLGFTPQTRANLSVCVNSPFGNVDTGLMSLPPLELGGQGDAREQIGLWLDAVHEGGLSAGTVVVMRPPLTLALVARCVKMVAPVAVIARGKRTSNHLQWRILETFGTW